MDRYEGCWKAETVQHQVLKNEPILPFQTDSKHVTYKSLVFMMRANLKHLQFQISTKKSAQNLWGSSPPPKPCYLFWWICGFTKPAGFGNETHPPLRRARRRRPPRIPTGPRNPPVELMVPWRPWPHPSLGRSVSLPLLGGNTLLDKQKKIPFLIFVIFKYII